jgi:hypothetical protein
MLLGGYGFAESLGRGYAYKRPYGWFPEMKPLLDLPKHFAAANPQNRRSCVLQIGTL